MEDENPLPCKCRRYAVKKKEGIELRKVIL